MRRFREMNVGTIILDVVADEQELDHLAKPLHPAGYSDAFDNLAGHVSGSSASGGRLRPTRDGLGSQRATEFELARQQLTPR